MKNSSILLLASVSLLSIAAPAAAQTEPTVAAPGQSADDLALTGDIVVTARRRVELLQDVPQTVNVVTAAQVDKLNLRTFTDLQSVVPGLTLTQQSSFNSSATVRGIAFDPAASGNNPSIEFYLNDAPISSNFLFQSLFDVGQFELQRGPQGTLRGRAAPSGALVFTTRLPDLGAVGATFSSTVTNQDAQKFEGAMNIPVIRDVLGIRLAGVIDNGKGNGVGTIKQLTDPDHNPDPKRDTKALRATVLFKPTDWLSAKLMYQTLNSESVSYAQVQSLSLVTGVPATTQIIHPFDRLSIEDQGARNRQHQEIYIANVDVRLAGQVLSYVGSFNRQDFNSFATQDTGDYFAPPRIANTTRTFTDPANNEPVCAQQSAEDDLIPTTNNFFQCTHGIAKRESHEVRLASEERIAGIFDYVIGGLYDHNETPSRLTSETPLLASPTRIASVNVTPIVRDGSSTEKSGFANLTAHIGKAIELAGGVRYIDYRDVSSIVVNNVRPVPDEADKLHATIYSVSAKYRFNDNFMVYANIGSSWRPGSHGVGDFSLRRSALESKFLDLPSETSTSYEIGAKTSFLDGRGRLNISLYHQNFDNYAYRGSPVYYVNYTSVGGVVTPAVANFNFLAAVPVKVDGAEAEASFQIMRRWSFGLNASYANGRITKGTIPCNDLNGDGVPDANPAAPTLAILQAALGTNNIAQCTGFNSRATFTPKFSANAQSEYSFDVTHNMSGFVRGLVTLFGETSGDPNNDFDSVPAYGLFNLYGGLRASNGAWEVSLFGKNLFGERQILSTTSAPLTNSLTTLRFSPTGQVIGTTASTYVSEYVPVTVTLPRELGITLRVALGSR